MLFVPGPYIGQDRNKRENKTTCQFREGLILKDVARSNHGAEPIMHMLLHVNKHEVEDRSTQRISGTCLWQDLSAAFRYSENSGVYVYSNY